MQTVKLRNDKAIKNCPKCLLPINGLLEFNSNKKLCLACIAKDSLKNSNWNNKNDKLQKIADLYSNKNKSYDCIVPVVGDAEDYFTLSKTLELGLSPLVVSVNDYFKNDIGWHNLHQLVAAFDVDSIFFNPDIRIYKDLVRTSLRKYNHIFLPFLQLHTSYPFHLAKQRKIPLIIWGSNQATELFGQELSGNYRDDRKKYHLSSIETDELIGSGAQVNPSHLNYYRFPNLSEDKSTIKQIYLSDYIKWDPLPQNASAISFGFQPETNSSSFDIYERAGSSVYYHLHDLLRLKTKGYRKINLQVARELRLGRITVNEGNALLEHYSSSKVDIKPFFDWLGVSPSGYEWYKLHQLDEYRNFINDSKVKNQEVSLPRNLAFYTSNHKEKTKDHILFGKGI